MRRNRHRQPNTTRDDQQQRARGLSLPPGATSTALTNQPGQQPGSYFQGQYGGFNVQGTNALPVAAYSDPRQRPGGSPFPPGDPIRPTPGLDNGDTRHPGPRQWSFPVGVNIATQPRQTESTPFETLRNLSALYEGIGLCETAIIRILERLTLTVTPRGEYLADAEDGTRGQWLEPGLRMAEWFQEGPDKQSNSDLVGWMAAVLRDIVELDAVGIWHQPTRDGSLHSLQYVAGDTLVCLVDEAGRTPLPPAPAYRQTLYGAPGVLLTTEDLDYLRITERTESPYGISPVERIILAINLALRKRNYDLTRYTDGATPEGVLQTSQPELFKMTVDEVMLWEQMWNGALSGNDKLRVRTKAVPPGWNFTSTEQRDIATALDDYLLNVTVAAFGLTKDEIGFTGTSNRSTGQSQEAVTYRNAVRPRTDFFARYFTRVIRRYDGKPLYPKNPFVSRPGRATKGRGTWDARYAVGWRGIEEPEDFVRRAGAYGNLVNMGIMSPTKAQKLLGIPLDPNEPYIPAYRAIQGGTQSIVILEDMLAQREQMAKTQTASLQASEASAKQTKAAMEAGVNGAGLAGNMAQVAQQTVAHAASVAGQGQAAIQPKATNPGAQAAAAAKQQAAAAAKQQAAGATSAHPTPATSPSSTTAQRRTDADRDDTQPPGPAFPAGREPGAGGGDVGIRRADIVGRPQPHTGAAPDADSLSRDGLVRDAARDADDAGATRDDRGAAGGLHDVAGHLAARRRGGADVDDAAGRHVELAVADGDYPADRDASSAATDAPRRDHDARGGASNAYAQAEPGRAARGGQSGEGGQTRDTDEQRTEQLAAQLGEPVAGSVSDEWARYRECALRDVKRGRAARAFASVLLPPALHAWVAAALAQAATPDAVRAVFAEARAKELAAPVGAAAAGESTPVPVSDPVVDPADRVLHALVARLEQVAEARAAAELREMRARVLDGLTL